MKLALSASGASRMLQISGLVLTLGIGTYLRFINLETAPGYYSDEGTLIEIAGHLLQGKWQYMALNRSTLLVARMPLFPLILAGASSLLGEGILALRLVTASLGILSILGTYLLADRLGGRRLALTASATLAIHPMAVVYSRLGFSYNLLAALTPILGLMSLRFIDRGMPRQIFVAGLLVGFGAISDLLMIVYIVPIALIGSTRGRRVLAALAFGFGLPLAAYVTYMAATAPDAFLFDLRFTLNRLGEIPLIAQFPVVSLNYAQLLQLDPWFIPAVIGVFVIQGRRSRWLMITLFILPLLLVGRSVTGLAGFGYYYVVPTLPYAAIGIAATVLVGIPRVHQTLVTGIDQLLASWGFALTDHPITWLRRRATAVVVALVLFVLVLSPFVISGMKTAIGVGGRLETPIDFLLVDPVAARETADFVNTRVDKADLVIASPAVAWLIDSRVSEFQLSLASTGKETLHFPLGIPRDRLEYDPSPDVARFVIIDGIWRNWAVRVMPEAMKLVEEVQDWPVRFRAADIQVHENPSLERP